MAAESVFRDGEPEARRYSLQLTFREDDPILVDRERLERRLTDELIAHMATDGFEMHKDTRLPGFSLHRHGPEVPAGKILARIECEVWKSPPLDLSRG